MTTLPTLENLDRTARNLHQAGRLLAALRKLLLEPMANYLELALEIRPEGVSTGRLPFGGELTSEVSLDFTQAALVFKPSEGAALSLPVAGRSQRSLFEDLLAILAAGGHDVAPRTAQYPSHTDAFLAVFAAKGYQLGHSLQLAGETPLEVDRRVAADYAQALYRIFTAVARFRARLAGPMTPIIVWPGGFDLSTLWFATPAATERHPHLNFGFAPYSAGFDRPYFYSYVYPLP
ncbi:MAG: DUF5996 family protein, partial [Chloroflexi bacterium]|nr:DUF5996 family protein [Chloroflexota bacterium]